MKDYMKHIFDNLNDINDSDTDKPGHTALFSQSHPG